MPQLEPQQLYSQVERSLDEQKFKPIYFFYGEEPYLIQQALNYLKTCALHGVPADFNFTTYHSSDADLNRVRDEVETLPMMATHRVVLLKDVHELSDSDWETLEPVLATPVDSTIFILVGQKIDKRKRFFKLLYEQAINVEFRRPFENQIPGWIRQICKAHGVSIVDEAVQLLHRLAGSQLTEIESEVRKLKDFLDNRTEITLEDVANCISKTREENVFELAEKIAKGDRVEALLKLADLLNQGQSEVGIVSLVARHMRLLLVVKEGMSQGLSGQKLAVYAQVPNYYLQEYIKQSQLWTSKQLESVILLLAETDRALKSSPLSSHIWLDNLVLKACQALRTNQSTYQSLGY